jgi:hypothetical protein
LVEDIVALVGAREAPKPNMKCWSVRVMDWILGYVLQGLVEARPRACLHFGAATFVAVIAGAVSAHIGQEGFAPFAAILGFVVYVIAILAGAARYNSN